MVSLYHRANEKCTCIRVIFYLKKRCDSMGVKKNFSSDASFDRISARRGIVHRLMHRYTSKYNKYYEQYTS